MGFNITQKQELAGVEDEGIDVPINDENGEPILQDDKETPVTIRIVGSLSKRYRKAQEKMRGGTLKRLGGGKKATGEAALGKESLEQQTEFVADCTLGWSPGIKVTQSGAEVDFPFSRENAVSLYTAFPFIQSQLEAAMMDHAAFFGKRSTSSVTP